MGLVTTKEMFKKAYQGNYAIGAFNINNMEILQAIMEAATKQNSPVIVQTSGSAIKYAGMGYIMKMMEAAIDDNIKNKKDIPVALHLDHGADFDICKFCVDSGYTSVMIDASKYDFETNVEMTRKVVDYAHSKGVVVEAELGKLAGVEDSVNVKADDAMYTNPEQAKEFVEKTGCDSLAIAIGTSHGAYKFKGDPRLRFDILQKVTKLMPGFPLVLHGASSIPQEYVDMCNTYGAKIPGAKGVPTDMLRQASKLGICKINVDSDIRLNMTGSIRKFFTESPEVFDPRKYLGVARDNIEEMISYKIINALGSNDKA